MEVGNINEKLKENILKWFESMEIQAGEIQVKSRDLLESFKLWMDNQNLPRPTLTQKLFTQTLMTKLPFKRIGDGTAFLTNSKTEGEV